MQSEENTRNESSEESVRELDEAMLLEALKETSIGTAGAVQVWSPEFSAY
jgi:hypothetical protein